MKISALLCCLAVSTSVLTAGPKDPLTVSRAWTDTIFKTSSPESMVKSLREQSEMLVETPSQRIINQNNLPPLKTPRIRNPLYDAPSYRVPKTLPNDRPRGAIPWEYNGSDYWLVPLVPPLKSY